MERPNQADPVISRQGAKTRAPGRCYCRGTKTLFHAKARRRVEQGKFGTNSPHLMGRAVFVEVGANRGNRREIPHRRAHHLHASGRFSHAGLREATQAVEPPECRNAGGLWNLQDGRDAPRVTQEAGGVFADLGFAGWCWFGGICLTADRVLLAPFGDSASL